ncbi:hypothetical protein FACS1894211_15850 [Clostridia bacterium]|nr:hypothetical protein FACS1894211_15850 [Clostridia bacterium]
MVEKSGKDADKNILPRSAIKDDDDVPFAWRHIVLVDRHSHAGRVLAKIKRGTEVKSGPLERT